MTLPPAASFPDELPRRSQDAEVRADQATGPDLDAVRVIIVVPPGERASTVRAPARPAPGPAPVSTLMTSAETSGRPPSSVKRGPDSRLALPAFA